MTAEKKENNSNGGGGGGKRSKENKKKKTSKKKSITPKKNEKTEEKTDIKNNNNNKPEKQEVTIKKDKDHKQQVEKVSEKKDKKQGENQSLQKDALDMTHVKSYNQEEEESSVSVYDSADEEEEYDSNQEDNHSETSSSDGEDEDEEAGAEFEDQGTSSEEEGNDEDEEDEDEEDSELEFITDEDYNEEEKKEEALMKRFGYDNPRQWKSMKPKHKIPSTKYTNIAQTRTPASPHALHMHTDDLSSDDEDDEGTTNRIGRVPLHWYDEYNHIGYNTHGKRLLKSASSSANGDLIDALLQHVDDVEQGKFTVYDALNDKHVTLTPRQIEVIRRIQHGAFAHPEFDGNPQGMVGFTNDKEISALHGDIHPPKRKFIRSQYERMLVKRILRRYKNGLVNEDWLHGKIKCMSETYENRPRKEGDDAPFLLWKGDEEDELALRKGPPHVPPPKLPPPTNVESYNPPKEYLPSQEELKEWEERDVEDRPHGWLVPKKFDSLREVGAYQHAVRERFERCLDLYMCPRMLKRRLNIDPESLVPSLPRASDLRPFPTSLCVQYHTPHNNNNNNDDPPPAIRCLSVSPDGQYLASGATDGYVRMWEVQSGRLLQSWNVSKWVVEDGGLFRKEKVVSEEDKEEQAEKTKQQKKQKNMEMEEDVEKKKEEEAETVMLEKEIYPVVAVQFNPQKSHHCLVAAVGTSAVVIATGTGNAEDAELTDALLEASASVLVGKAEEEDDKDKDKEGEEEGGESKKKEEKKQMAVQWRPLFLKYQKERRRKLKELKKKKKKQGQKDPDEEEEQEEEDKDDPISKHASESTLSFFGPTCHLYTQDLISSIEWHHRGDYFVTVAPKAGAASVLVHQLSRAHSQQPFAKRSKGRGQVQAACFHPNKPFLFVATQRHVRVYHLLKQKMVKKLITGCRWISSMAIHRTGDHVIMGSLDRRVVWFDLDLASTPYKTLKYHERAVRAVKYHPRYPLFATCSDDGSVHVFHGTVYSDLMRNPLLVPVKVLKGHDVKKEKKTQWGVFAIDFHPTQPWLFSGGVDGRIHLWQDI